MTTAAWSPELDWSTSSAARSSDEKAPRWQIRLSSTVDIPESSNKQFVNAPKEEPFFFRASPDNSTLLARVQCMSGLLVPATFLSGSGAIIVILVLLILWRLLNPLSRVLGRAWNSTSRDRQDLRAVETRNSQDLDRACILASSTASPARPLDLNHRQALTRLRFYARSTNAEHEAAHDRRLTEQLLPDPSKCSEFAQMSTERRSVDALSELQAEAEQLRSEISNMKKAQQSLTSPDNFAELAKLQRQCQARQKQLESLEERIKSLKSAKLQKSRAIEATCKDDSDSSSSFDLTALHCSPSPRSCILSRLLQFLKLICRLTEGPTVLYVTKIFTVTMIASTLTDFPGLRYLLLSESSWKSYSFEQTLSARIDDTQCLYFAAQSPLEPVLPNVSQCSGVFSIFAQTRIAGLKDVTLTRVTDEMGTWTRCLSFFPFCLVVLVDLGLCHFFDVSNLSASLSPSPPSRTEVAKRE